MKKIFLLIFLFPCLLWAEKFKVEAIFYPAVVSLGETVTVRFVSNKQGTLRFKLPELEGCYWLKNRICRVSRKTVVNGSVSHYTCIEIPLLVEKTGAVTIPPITVRCGNETAQTRELMVKVQGSPDKSISPERALPAPTGEISVPGKRSVFYVGEEIPLELSLLIPEGTRVNQLAYPELSGLDGAVMTDYSKVNPRTPLFAPPVDRRRVIGQEMFTEVIFKTSFRALRPGVITPSAVAQMNILRPGEQMNEDNFYGGFFSYSSVRMVPFRVKFKFKAGKIDVRALPQVAEKTHFLNLVGAWRISAVLSSRTAKVGEPVELTVTVAGEGNSEALNAPALQIPGFRIYPPDVKKYPGRTEIKYALIPLEAGEKKLTPAFAVFDPVQGRYIVSQPELLLAVVAGNAPQSAVVADTARGKKENVPLEPEKKSPPPVRNELFYQKSAPGGQVELPLMKNQWFRCIFVLLAGICGGAFFKWRNWRKELEKTDSAFRMKNELQHQLKDVLAQLKEHDYSADKVREIAVPFLAQALGLSPGASPEEVAEKVRDPELAEWLRTLNFAGFMPGSEGGESLATAGRIKSLLKALKRCGILLLALGAFTLEAGFNTAFEAGKYDEAEKEYRRFVTSGKWSSHALYNLGAVYYMKNDLPMARLCLLRAHLLAPMDAETLENLNLINRKLMQPELDRASSPGELLLWCRDRLRPDQYVFLFCCAIAVLLVLAGLKKRSSGSIWYWSAGAAALAALLFAAAAVSLNMTLYSKQNAVVVSREIKLRSLPAESGKVEATLPGGGSAWIVETRDQWSRIRINGQDGWVKNQDIQAVLPEGIF